MGAKKKILLVPSWYPSDASPVNGIFVQDRAQILSRIYDVAVLVPEAMGLRRCVRSKQWHTLSMVEERAGVHVYRESRPAVLAKLEPFYYWTYLAVARRGFERVLASWGRPDIIHAHVVLPAGWAAAKLGRQYGIPVALTEHSDAFSMNLGTSWRRRIVRETLQSVDAVIAVSPAAKSDIQSFYSDAPITVMGNVIKTEFFVPPEAAQVAGPRLHTRFLAVALLTERKGLAYLLEAARMLLRQGLSSFEIVVGGDGPERPHLEEMARAIGVADHCRFLGLLSPAEVRNWMQQCDVFVLPSLRESFCIVLGEAMACGKPVISTRCGGPEFIVTPGTGILVDVADPSALAGAMAGFITGESVYDPELIRSTVVQRFGEDAYLRHIAVLYEDMGGD